MSWSTCCATARCIASTLRLVGVRLVAVVGGAREHPSEFRPVSGRHRARVEESVGQPVQQVGRHGRSFGEFQLPLTPLLLAALTRRRRHLVVAELGDRRAFGVVEQVDGAFGGDSGDGPQRPVTHDGQHDVLEIVRDRAADAVVQRHPHLGAGVRARRQLEMPARVRSAGPSAQRDVVGGQVVGCGVVVDGLELLGRRALNARHGRKALEGR